jgi:hypothetical protein
MKWSLPFIIAALLSVFAVPGAGVGAAAPGGGGAGAESLCAPSQIQRDYFTRIGIGGNYGPHYPCYDQNGVIAQCISPTGTTPPFVAQDAKNAAIQTSIPLDIHQLQTAGFQAVRAYGDPPLTWITLIETVKSVNEADPTRPLSVVYQVSGCGSDVTLPNHPCEGTGVPFQTVLQQQLNNLKQVIAQVGAATFQSVVRLVIVTNEDLVAPSRRPS